MDFDDAKRITNREQGIEVRFRLMVLLGQLRQGAFVSVCIGGLGL